MRIPSRRAAAIKHPLSGSAPRRLEGPPLEVLSDNLRLWVHDPTHLANHPRLLQPLDSPRNQRRLQVHSASPRSSSHRLSGSHHSQGQPLASQPLANHHSRPLRALRLDNHHNQPPRALRLDNHHNQPPRDLHSASRHSSARSLALLGRPHLDSLRSLPPRAPPPLDNLHNQPPKDPPSVNPANWDRNRTPLARLLLQQLVLSVLLQIRPTTPRAHSVNRQPPRERRPRLVRLALLRTTRVKRSRAHSGSLHSLRVDLVSPPRRRQTPLPQEPREHPRVQAIPVLSGNSQRSSKVHLVRAKRNSSSPTAPLVSPPKPATHSVKAHPAMLVPSASSRPTMLAKHPPRPRRAAQRRTTRIRLIAPGVTHPSRATAPRAWTET